MIAINPSRTVTPVFHARTIRGPVESQEDDDRKNKAAVTSAVRSRCPGSSSHRVRRMADSQSCLLFAAIVKNAVFAESFLRMFEACALSLRPQDLSISSPENPSSVQVN